MMCPMYPAARTKATNATNRISAEVAAKSLLWIGWGSGGTSMLLEIARIEPFSVRRRTPTYVTRSKLTCCGECRETTNT